MAITKEAKKKKIEEIRKRLQRQKAIAFVDYSGLTTPEINQLKKNLRENNCEFQVIKKTLAQIAFKEEGLEFDRDFYKGQLAFIYGYEDEITPFKLAFQFFKKNEKLKLVGGYHDGSIIGKQEAEQFAQLPSRQELESAIVSRMTAPLYGFLNAISYHLKGLVVVLNNRINQLQ